MSVARYALLNLVTRVFSFGLNSLLVKWAMVDPHAFGVVFGRTEVYKDMVFAIGREAMRLTAMRVSLADGKVQNYGHVVRCGFIAIFLCFSLVAVACAAVIFSSEVSYALMLSDHEWQLWWAYNLAILVEVAVEPLVLIQQYRGNLQYRMMIETVANLVRSACVFAVIIAGHHPLHAYAFGQLMLALMIAVLWTAVSRHEPLTVSPEPLPSPLWKVGQSMLTQSVVKFAVGESDKIVMSQLASAQERGIYAYINNYISLVVRIVFLPVEDTARMQFSVAGRDDKKTPVFLQVVVKAYLYMGILAAVFGCSYSAVVFRIISGASWNADASAHQILAAYCILLPFMAINGVAEAYAQVKSTSAEVQGSSWYFVAIGCVGYACGTLAFQFKLGAVGVVHSALVCTLLRLIRNWYIIGSHCSDLSQANVLPSLWFVSFMTAMAATINLLPSFGGNIEDLAIGGALGLVSLAFMYASQPPISLKYEQLHRGS